jgi:hypothetical protein
MNRSKDINLTNYYSPLGEWRLKLAMWSSHKYKNYSEELRVTSLSKIKVSHLFTRISYSLSIGAVISPQQEVLVRSDS